MSTHRHIEHRNNPAASLQSEWRRLSYCPHALERVNSWKLTTRTLWSLDEVLRLSGFQGAKCDPVADQVLATIVRRAATDDLAARIVLQRVLPPMLSIARRRGFGHGTTFDSAFGLVLSHAWEIIRTYPIVRRPRKIAANIVRDIEYFAFVRGQRNRPVHTSLDENIDTVELRYASDSLTSPPLVDGIGGGRADESEFGVLLAEAVQHHLSDRSRTVLQALSMQTVEEFAATKGVSARTVRTWRRDAVNELRARTQCVE